MKSSWTEVGASAPGALVSFEASVKQLAVIFCSRGARNTDQGGREPDAADAVCGPWVGYPGVLVLLEARKACVRLQQPAMYRQDGHGKGMSEHWAWGRLRALPSLGSFFC